MAAGMAEARARAPHQMTACLSAPEGPHGGEGVVHLDRNARTAAGMEAATEPVSRSLSHVTLALAGAHERAWP
jgi:hypothetical protein